MTASPPHPLANLPDPTPALEARHLGEDPDILVRHNPDISTGVDNEKRRGPRRHVRLFLGFAIFGPHLPVSQATALVNTPTHGRLLDRYLAEISTDTLLTPDEEAELARRIRSGDDEALRRLTSANLRFVVTVAKKYQGRGMSLPDLINEGNCGLIEAAQRFDETRGGKFITYAVWWIRQAIVKALNDHTRTVRLPLNRITAINKVSRASRRLTQRHKRTPTPQELADESLLDLEKVREAIRLSSLSLEIPLGRTAPLDTSRNTTATPDREFDLLVAFDLPRMLNSLPAREAHILTLCFGLGLEQPLTLETIGRRLGITRERVRQLRNQALATLRQRFSAAD